MPIIDPDALKIAKALAAAPSEAPVERRVTAEALHRLAFALLQADRDLKTLKRQVSDERDRLAAKAMQGILSSDASSFINRPFDLAESAYDASDAMLQERERRKRKVEIEEQLQRDVAALPKCK